MDPRAATASKTMLRHVGDAESYRFGFGATSQYQSFLRSHLIDTGRRPLGSTTKNSSSLITSVALQVQ